MILPRWGFHAATDDDSGASFAWLSLSIMWVDFMVFYAAIQLRRSKILIEF